jgi:hypothetical protein
VSHHRSKEFVAIRSVWVSSDSAANCARAHVRNDAAEATAPEMSESGDSGTNAVIVRIFIWDMGKKRMT